MIKKIILTMLFAGSIVSAVAQNTLNEVLQSIERNNLTLQAAKQQAEGKSLEARMGNSLDDLSVSYDHLWGKPVSEYGKTGELNISQSFDFPTVYADRSKVAGNLSRQYMNELTSTRQQILLDAKLTYFELQTAYIIQSLLDYRRESTQKLMVIYRERFDNNDASVFEKSKIEHEYLLFLETVSENRSKIVELEKKLTTLNGGIPISIRNIIEPVEELEPFAKIAEDYTDMYPALLAFKIQKEGAEYDLKLSRSQALPKFELGYKHEYASEGERFNGVTAGLSIPIFSNRHNVKRAKAFLQAAELESRSAEVECATQLEEFYGKAELLGSALAEYREIGGHDKYLDMLSTALELGELSVVEYFSEIYSYYDVLLSKLRLQLEYNQTVATINIIYL